jgi:hypothetical protein
MFGIEVSVDSAVALKLLKAVAKLFNQGAGDRRELLDELGRNSMLLFFVAEGDKLAKDIAPQLSDSVYKRLRGDCNFQKFKYESIRDYDFLKETDLAAWGGKSTTDLIEAIYQKIRFCKIQVEQAPEKPNLRRLLLNVHWRILLLFVHLGVNEGKGSLKSRGRRPVRRARARRPVSSRRND